MSATPVMFERWHHLAPTAWRRAWQGDCIPVSSLARLTGSSHVCPPTDFLSQHPLPLPLTLLLEDAPLDEFEGQKDGALLLQCGGVGGHGAWCDAPDVCVVPAAGHVEHRPRLTRPKHLGVESHSELRGCPCPQGSQASALTGVMTVRSGRWLPPALGWLLSSTSPGWRSAPRCWI